MKLRKTPNYRPLLLGLVFLCAAALFTLGNSPVYAASWSKMPSGTPIPPNTQVIPLNYKAGATKIAYNTSAYPGKFKTIAYKNGTQGLCVKISSQTASYSYSNFCTVTYPKATTLRGRYIDVKLEFTSMTIGPKKGNDYLCSDGYMAFARITPGAGTNVFDSANMTNRYDGNRRGYGAKKNLTTKVTVTWSDTGETVKLPFYQGVRDIDATDDYFTEGWYGGSGFASTFYIWPTCINSPSGTTMMAKTTNPATSGNEEYTKTGLIAPTTGGIWYMAWYGGNCGTGLRVYSQYKDLEAPTKSVDKSIAVKDETITWTVSQKVGTFYTDMYSAYSNFRFSDTIPEGVKYQSAKVYNGSAEITSQGTLTYNEDTRQLTFTLNSSLLAPQSFYKGQTISMQIAVTAENPKEASEIIANQAASVISGESQNTNTVTTVIRRPDLGIAKKAERETYQSYEDVVYTVTVWQKTEGLALDDITVTDTLPEQMALQGKPTLSGASGTVAVNGNAWTAELDSLDYGDLATITFTGTLEKIRIDKDLTNEATAKAEDVPDAAASAVIHVNPLPLTIQAVKNWEDEDDFYGLRPDSVKVELLQDGEPIRELTLRESEDWKGSFEDLPEYRTETERYKYTVQEADPPKGYEASIKQMEETGEFVRKVSITNRLAFYELTIRKEIAKEDSYLPHRDATFLYRVTSKRKPEQKWYTEIVLAEGAAEPSGGMLTASKTLSLPYGEYLVEELPALRYEGGITETEGAVTVDETKQSALVRLYNQGEKALITYTNEKTRWDRYSHNDLVINRLR